MELKNLINQMGSQRCELDPYEISISDVLIEGKYSKLLSYLIEKNIKTTNDLKRLNNSDYNKLKMGIPDIYQVGDEKEELFIKKIDNIRNDNNTRYKRNTQLELDILEKENYNTLKPNYDFGTRNIGTIRTSRDWRIEVNQVKYVDNNEFINIREIASNGLILKEISIKKEFIHEFKKIVQKIPEDSLESQDISLDDLLSKKEDRVHTKETNSFDMFEELMTSGNLKQLIMQNEDKLYKEFKHLYGQNILLFKSKIDALSLDGDIVKFLNNPSILGIKKEQYDSIHERGMQTAIDIMNDYNKNDLSYTKINDLKIGDKINTMTICAMVNNFNLMLGMYYNEEEDYIVLKSQTSGGDYNNKWIDDNTMLYYLQNEKKEKYVSLEFSHRPNQICRDILLNLNFKTKIYLFDRNNKKEDYTFCGEFKPIKFSNNNRCIILKKINK